MVPLKNVKRKQVCVLIGLYDSRSVENMDKTTEPSY